MPRHQEAEGHKKRNVNPAIYIKPRTKRHCKGISSKLLAAQQHISAKTKYLIQSGKIGPQQLDALMPQSVVGTPPDPDEDHLIFKQHRSVNDTYLSQIIRDWVEQIRQKSPEWEATAEQVWDWREGVTNGPTLQEFSYFFDGRPTLDYNRQAIHLLSSSLMQAFWNGEYATHLLQEAPASKVLTKKISNHMRYLSTKLKSIKSPRTLEELNERQAQERRNTRRHTLYQHHLQTAGSDERWSRFLPIIKMAGVHMHSDDESDHDEDFKFHFRVKVLPYKAPLLLQIFRNLDELNAAISKASSELLVQRRETRSVERQRVGDIPSISKAPTSLPSDLYNSQWLDDNIIHRNALGLAPAIGLRGLILN